MGVVLGVLACAGAGVALIKVGVPTVLALIGFTAIGITKKSTAAAWMAAAATANGGGILAGSLVSILQGIAMGRFSRATTLAAGLLGAVLGLLVAFGPLWSRSSSMGAECQNLTSVAS
mmetsp:Transcript_31912/g.58444  ORF Transcript_31912/g.58444 Transcript_31912/m.58444 type:complete len:118 (+) Transcript_31912:125-478(+)